MKKLVVVGVILLFLGVTIAPTINFNVVKASTENEYVDVVSEACGMKGFGNATARLTRQQYEDLEMYLTDFSARLNQTTTKEDALLLFKEAVLELNKYGLLPRGMSVPQAQKLVTEAYRLQENSRLSNFFQHSLNKMNNSNLDNAFCLVTGYLSDSLYLQVVLWTLLWSLAYSNYYHLFLRELLFLFFSLTLPFIVFKQLFPVHLMTGITFRGQGHLNTYGLLGQKKWNGYLIGGFSRTYGFNNPFGILGFTGFHIVSVSGWYGPFNSYLIGSAVAVGVDEY